MAYAKYTTKYNGRPLVVGFWLRISVYTLWSDVAVTCGHNTISTLWGNMAYYVKLSGEHLSLYSNTTESVCLRKCPYYCILQRKWCHYNKRFLQIVPRHGGKSAGIDMTWRNFVTVVLRRPITLWEKFFLIWTQNPGMWSFSHRKWRHLHQYLNTKWTNRRLIREKVRV